MQPETYMLENPTAKNENDSLSKALVAILMLLTSFACVFCSAQSALWFIDRSRVEAQTIATNREELQNLPEISNEIKSNEINEKLSSLQAEKIEEVHF